MMMKWWNVDVCNNEMIWNGNEILNENDNEMLNDMK